jgi:hypothetical protein
MLMKTKTLPGILLIFFLIFQSTLPSSLAAADQAIYTDALASGWQNWPWENTTINLDSTSPVYSGTRAISVKYDAAWAGLYLHNTGVDLTNYDRLRFWIHGGSAGGQHLRVVANNIEPGVAVSATAGHWTQVVILFADLGGPGVLSDLYWQDTNGGAQPVFSIDQIELLERSGTVTPEPAPALSVNAAAGRKPISPYIYGMNFADAALANELDLPVNRRGGNSTSRYNWMKDAYNTGSDWYFENIAEENDNPGSLPNGSAADRFVEQNQGSGTDSILTIPMIGWVAKSRKVNHPFDCGYKVSKYGAQQSVDQWDTDCGNGVRASGSKITGNKPEDTSAAANPQFVGQWVAHLVEQHGDAASGGVRFYNLDNEPMLWNSTHRDVHPGAVTYNELRDLTYQYAAAVKQADPTALTLGPVLWGWCAYLYSAADGCTPGSDYANHGNMYFVPWYLQQMQSYETQHEERILDYLDLHYYPQADGVSLADSPGSAATQALRLRSTRSLWDPTYIDESWISDGGGVAVNLINRMKTWVNDNYPGTKLAITEYNWGALGYLNGALAQADVLGIFGREGVDLATLWSPPEASDPGAYAFRMYRNFDGQGQKFGETGVQASSTNQDKLAVYAAQRSDQALTILVINKTGSAITSTLSLSGFDPLHVAQVYRYSSASLSRIVMEAGVAVTQDGFSAAYPANSITLFVLPPNIPLENHVYLPAMRR